MAPDTADVVGAGVNAAAALTPADACGIDHDGNMPGVSSGMDKGAPSGTPNGMVGMAAAPDVGGAPAAVP